ncbi:MAG TPA: hypothetical protein ENN13_04665 [Candidatus Altiarchaeales archaeon]|nr:hypothetical protein [Candidatus Altiarchaeales archaeon]
MFKKLVATLLVKYLKVTPQPIELLLVGAFAGLTYYLSSSLWTTLLIGFITLCMSYMFARIFMLLRMYYSFRWMKNSFTTAVKFFALDDEIRF